jgi:Ni/Fe-hydrogenase subunit HybB-like protein
MKVDNLNDRLLKISKPFHAIWILFFILLVLLGTIAFLTGMSGKNSERAWHAYLINFVFWVGLSSGAFFFVAVMNMTKSKWARPVKRLGEAFGTFLPVSFLLLLVLYFGRREIFVWIKEPIPGKETWLNARFLFARDGIGILVLTGISLALIYHSIKGDKKVMSQSLERGGKVFDSNEKANKREDSSHWRAQVYLSPILGIAYGFVLSLIAIDLIMSLDPHWVSTLFGAYFFLSSFYLGLAALAIVSVLSLNSFGLKDYVHSRYFHDLGKLVFAFCLLTGYFFYAQFLVIWYGNIPEETQYVILRVRQSPWGPLAWAILGAAFILPFIVLLSRKMKMKPISLMVVSILILIGIWMERFLFIAPSFWKGEEIPIGILEILITAGFFGLMALSLITFLRRFPFLPVSDPLFQEFLKSEGTRKVTL